MNLRLISLILFSFTGFQLIAQTRITGLVKESSGMYVADIYVIAGEPGVRKRGLVTDIVESIACLLPIYVAWTTFVTFGLPIVF